MKNFYLHNNTIPPLKNQTFIYDENSNVQKKIILKVEETQHLRIPFQDLTNTNTTVIQDTPFSLKQALSSQRIKKSNGQISILKKTFLENNEWSKGKIDELSRITNLKHTQVYKWYWDQKIKSKRKENDNGNKQIKNVENPMANTKFMVGTQIFLTKELYENEEIRLFFK